MMVAASYQLLHVRLAMHVSQSMNTASCIQVRADVVTILVKKSAVMMSKTINVKHVNSIWVRLITAILLARTQNMEE